MSISKQAPSPTTNREPAHEPSARRQAVVTCLGIALTLVLSASSQTVAFAGAGVIDNPTSGLFAALSTFSSALFLIGSGLATLRHPQISKAFAPLFVFCTLLSLMLWVVGTRVGQQWFGTAPVLLIGSACSWGIGIGSGLMFWIPALRAFALEKAVVVAACATCVSGCLEAVTFSISNPWGRSAALAVLVTAAALLAARAPGAFPAAPSLEPVPQSPTRLARSMGAPVLLVAVTGFASGALRALAQPQDSRLHLLALLLCTLAAGTLYILCARYSVYWFDTQAIRTGTLVIVSTVFLVFPLTKGTTAVFLQAVVDVCYMVGSIYIKTLCARQDVVGDASVPCAAGLSYGSVFLLVGLGFTLNRGLLMAFGGSSTSSLMLSVIALYLIVIVFILALSHKASASSQVPTDPPPAIVFDLISETDLRSSRALREQYRISEREMDVMVLMMGGESIAAVSKTLALSENTVKTHIKKIYSKLGVHTKDEFRQLIRSIMESGS